LAFMIGLASLVGGSHLSRNSRLAQIFDLNLVDTLHHCRIQPPIQQPRLELITSLCIRTSAPGPQFFSAASLVRRSVKITIQAYLLFLITSARPLPEPDPLRDDIDTDASRFDVAFTPRHGLFRKCIIFTGPRGQDTFATFDAGLRVSIAGDG
jgi:hypothetical protein